MFSVLVPKHTTLIVVGLIFVLVLSFWLRKQLRTKWMKSIPFMADVYQIGTIKVWNKMSQAVCTGWEHISLSPLYRMSGLNNTLVLLWFCQTRPELSKTQTQNRDNTECFWKKKAGQAESIHKGMPERIREKVFKKHTTLNVWLAKYFFF